jgi:prepilin-type N-terminal cleavage/methylation domain-containing protein
MFSLFSHSKHTQPNVCRFVQQAGFGLIELMVSISVMAIVSSIILVRQNSFNGGVLLRSQAYEIALAAREVQLNAVSAIGVTGNFRSLQGLHFDTNDLTDGLYRVFFDGDADGFYDSNESIGQQGVLDGRFEIKDIRAVGDSFSGTALSVVFERPDFDARFFDSAGEVNASRVEIDIARRDSSGVSCGSEFRTIEITQTGQITVLECP